MTPQTQVIKCDRCTETLLLAIQVRDRIVFSNNQQDVKLNTSVIEIEKIIENIRKDIKK